MRAGIRGRSPTEFAGLIVEKLRKGGVRLKNITRDISGEARLVERAFGLGACPLAEAVRFVSKRLGLEAA
jgi:transposase, IS6 family